MKKRTFISLLVFSLVISFLTSDVFASKPTLNEAIYQPRYLCSHYACPYQKVRILIKESLAYHLATEHGEVSCGLCWISKIDIKKFSTKIDLKRHLMKEHGQDSKELYFCPREGCGYFHFIKKFYDTHVAECNEAVFEDAFFKDVLGNYTEFLANSNSNEDELIAWFLDESKKEKKQEVENKEFEDRLAKYSLKSKDSEISSWFKERKLHLKK